MSNCEESGREEWVERGSGRREGGGAWGEGGEGSARERFMQ